MFILSRFAAGYGAKLSIVAHDYARKIRSFDDLPNLFAILNEAKQATEAQANPYHIFIDDYARLFRVVTPEFRDELWDALSKHAAFITDLRQGVQLDTVSKEKSTLIRNGVLPHLKERAPNKQRSKDDKQAQTAKARLVSVVARSKHVTQSANELKEAFDTYVKENPRGSFRDFIASDAATPLRNSHGKQWAYRSGLRALRLLRAGEGKV
jgi:hypothetical protein